MAGKHALEGDEISDAKRQKGGFKVGPENLPDGVHRRKVQKIKRDLIEKARLKKQYAKVKARELDSQYDNDKPRLVRSAESPGSDEQIVSPSLAPHPDRLARLKEPNISSSSPPAASQDKSFAERREERREKTRQHKANRKQNQLQKLQAGAEENVTAREVAEQERRRKIAERDLWRRRVAKAKRPGKDGKRKLGRESGLLLEKVKRLVQGGAAG